MLTAHFKWADFTIVVNTEFYTFDSYQLLNFLKDKTYLPFSCFINSPCLNHLQSLI